MPIDYDWIASEMDRSRERAMARRAERAPAPVTDDRHVTVAQLAPGLLVTIPSHRSYTLQRVIDVRHDGATVTLHLRGTSTDTGAEIDESITLPAEADAVVHDDEGGAPLVGVVPDARTGVMPINEPMLEPDILRDAARTPLLGPPPAANRVDFPYVGTIDFQGLPVLVETARGDTRRGVDPDGNAWEVVMPAHYGEIAGTVGVDGDPVDVFVGDDANAPDVYVFHTRHAGTREYDEDKAFLGFRTLTDARRAFFAAYDRRGMLESVTTWTVEDFKRAMTRRDLTEEKLDGEARAAV